MNKSNDMQKPAKKVDSIWEKSSKANQDHPYLIRKGIQPYGLRLKDDGRLIVPVSEDGKIWSLQYIDSDGDKEFLYGGRTKGCYCCLGKIQDAQAVCIVEGFATGATIREATSYPVVIAFYAGNLELVAKAVRQKSPELPIVICADDDAHTEGNPGLTCAYKAARAIGAKVAIPVFQAPRLEGASDFNDMARQVGLKEVAKVIHAAKQPGIESENNDWPDPQPLIATIEPESYPIDALPDLMRAAVEEVQGFTKAPIPLVASSALAAMSLAVQAHVDVKRDERLNGPVSLNLLTIADSGERKSTCDEYFMQPIREYEAEQEDAAKPLKRDYAAKMEAWEAKRSGITAKIRALSKAGTPTKNQEATLCKLEEDKPELSRVPQLIICGCYTGSIEMGSGKSVALQRRDLKRRWSGFWVVWHGQGFNSAQLDYIEYSLGRREVSTERRTSESFTVRVRG